MSVGLAEALVILFCCVGLFGLPTALLIWYILRRQRPGRPSDPELDRDREI